MEDKAKSASELAKLLDNPSFQYLALIVGKKRDKLLGVLTAAILSGQLIDQRKIDYMRGWSDGAMSVVERPENAEAEFASVLKRLDKETNGS